jgi:protein-S-isoprenylcysteine O-methyltransferase Ste14
VIASWLPLLGMITFFVVGVAWRGWLQFRTHGYSGIVLFRGGEPRQQLRDLVFCAVFGALATQTALFAVTPGRFARLFVVASTPAMAWAGAAVMAAGLAVTVAAQLGMGASWRIGIDHDARPGLVTAGLYQWCRNPIYLGLIASLAGLVVMLPTYVSAALAAAALWCIRSQTLEEEAYLDRTYGEEFRRYAARVGRFVPGLGRLAAAG